MRHTRLKRLISLSAAFFLAASMGFSGTVSAAADTGKKLDVVFVHDTHSHLNPFSTVVDGKSTILGGFSPLKTIIDEAKTKNPDTLVVDAGDFSMGTLVQTIFSTESSELRMLGAIDCEVTTLGNHEFDYRASGLAGALNVAAESTDKVPELVISNIDWAAMEAEGLTDEQKLLKDAFDHYGVKEYTVVQKGDVKIALFGLFGVDSLKCAPTCVLKFRDCSEAATDVIRKIKADEDVDMIVCLSHSGTDPNIKKSEDEILAKNVPEIDLIISGHTHTVLENAIKHGDTYIASCGEYEKNVGTLSMHQKSDGRWELDTYELIPLTTDIVGDEPTQAKVDSFMEIVDSTYLSDFGYTRQQILAENSYVFSTSPDLYAKHTEHNLGNLLSDAFRYTAMTMDTGDDHPVDVTIVPSGCIRDTFAIGNITVEDVFNAYSLGIGLDGVPGYPLISVYVTGKELKTAAEIDASLSDIMTSARLYNSGLNTVFNPHRILLNKITDCYLTDYDGNRVEIEDDRLYRVVCDLYSGQMLGAVNDVSMGLLSLQPKFADGTPIENIEDAIIHSNGKEIKAWAAIAGYIDSFEDTDGNGIGNVPPYYGTTQNRKVVVDSRNIFKLISHPNVFSVVIVLVVLVAIALIALIIFLIVKLIRRICSKKNTLKA